MQTNIDRDRVYAQLGELNSEGRLKLTDEERTVIAIKAIDNHPQGLLHFPGANLTGIDFSPATLKRLSRKFRNSAFLKNQRAELTDADLRHATLKGANFEEAGLMAAVFDGATLIGANFHKAGMPLAQFLSADLRYTNFSDGFLYGADFGDAWLLESNFRRALLGGANFQSSTLEGVDLREAELKGHPEPSNTPKFSNASFQHANLEFVDFTGCKLDHVYLFGAKLDRTIIKQEQLGGAIGEEIDKDYFKAAKGYFILRKNFETLGDQDAERWAYIKERVMTRKLHAQQMTMHYADKRMFLWIREFLSSITNWIVELTCNYGESIARVVSTILMLIFVIGPGLLSISGRLIWPQDRVHTYNQIQTIWGKFWYGYLQTLLYTLDAVTASSYSNLQPGNYWVLLTTHVISLLGIFLVGLLGFVSGNRIRH